jgi:hypothetical protein
LPFNQLATVILEIWIVDATNLGKVLAYVISGTREIMAERARVPSLAGSLAEELARHM